MVKWLGIPTFFLTLSCADLKWHELTSIIYKLTNFTSFDDDLKNLIHEERWKYLKANPVLIPRQFQYRVQVFFTEVLFDPPLGKDSYYVYRVEFQIRESLHIHPLIWIQNAPNLTPKTKE